MARKLKAGGLAFFAILLMGSMMASAASATEFTAEEYPAEITGTEESPNVFKSDGYETKCEEVTFHTILAEPSTTATITPTYALCKAFGLNATVDMNECAYTVTLPAGTATHVQAEVTLKCPTGKEVTITAGGGACIAHIPPFTKKKHITISNNHPHITGLITVSGIKATLTDVSPFLCPFTGETTVENATYEGPVTFTGENVDTISISG